MDKIQLFTSEDAIGLYRKRIKEEIGNNDISKKEINVLRLQVHR